VIAQFASKVFDIGALRPKAIRITIKDPYLMTFGSQQVNKVSTYKSVSTSN
jgi:hypothetical protein